MFKPRFRQGGMTLIELVVTLAVLALLLMAAAPSVSEWVRNTRIRNTATSIQAGLMKARSEALRRNTPVVFSLVSLTDRTVMDDSCALSASGVSWVVSLQAPAGSCASAASDTKTVSDDGWAEPKIIDKQAGGARANTVVVTAQASLTDTTSRSTATFNGFGRLSGTAIGHIDIRDVSGADSSYRSLRLVLSSGGTIRMCDPKVSANTDPRKC
ncbi:GspH/FimT family pseudopilin [Variovorax paradoxus]|nr:GspH/FimT family pseudopilin [Variovorax paradoxus]